MTDTTDTTDKPRGRGRPRPLDVIGRDEKILELLHAHPRTKAEIMELTRLTPEQTYLALRRMALAGRIRRHRAGEHKRNIWEVVS
jgi:predicted Rossmann fold nucleotide-binding protein DprA/Smf involved in DNA uptake